MGRVFITYALYTTFGIMVAAGGYQLTGYPMVGSVFGLIVLLLMYAMQDASSQQEMRAVSASARKEAFDACLDAGHKMIVEGNEWKRGCRINPETSAVIYPS